MPLRKFQKMEPESLSTLSILVVFSSVFFDVTYRDYSEFIKSDFNYPHGHTLLNQKKHLKNEFNNIKRHLLRLALLFFSFLLLTYLLIPTTIEVLLNTSFSVWDFELSPTLVVFLEVYLIVFSLLTLVLIIKVFKRRKSSLRIRDKLNEKEGEHVRFW